MMPQARAAERNDRAIVLQQLSNQNIAQDGLAEVIRMNLIAEWLSAFLK